LGGRLQSAVAGVIAAVVVVVIFESTLAAVGRQPASGTAAGGAVLVRPAAASVTTVSLSGAPAARTASPGTLLFGSASEIDGAAVTGGYIGVGGQRGLQSAAGAASAVPSSGTLARLYVSLLGSAPAQVPVLFTLVVAGRRTALSCIALPLPTTEVCSDTLGRARVAAGAPVSLGVTGLTPADGTVSVRWSAVLTPSA
jgi:hypothetical protein